MAESAPTVTIVRDPAGGAATAPPAEWAAEELRADLTRPGIAVQAQVGAEIMSEPGSRAVLVAGPASAAAQALLVAAGAALPAEPEALALVAGSAGAVVNRPYFVLWQVRPGP